MPKPPRRSPPRTRKTDDVVERVAGASLVAKPEDPRQAGLFDLPLPGWMRPYLPTLVDKPPSGPQWVHEIKWDGYRVSVYVEAGKVTIRKSATVTTRPGDSRISRAPPQRRRGARPAKRSSSTIVAAPLSPSCRPTSTSMGSIGPSYGLWHWAFTPSIIYRARSSPHATPTTGALRTHDFLSKAR